MERRTPKSRPYLTCVAFFISAGAYVWPAGAADTGDPNAALAGGAMLWWLIQLVLGVVITSAWYWLGARMFRFHPLFPHCLMAAIIPPIFIFFAQLLAGIVVGIFAVISIYLGILALIVALLWLFVVYIRWVRNMLEIESTGVVVLLVVLPAMLNIALSALLSAES